MTQICEKVLIKLHKGSYLDLMCHSQYILSGKPSVAYNSSGIQDLISRGKAKLYGIVPEKANQEDFDKILKQHKNNEDKAIKDFLKAYSIEEEPETTPETETTPENETNPENEK